MPRYIDVTPTWEAILPVLVTILEDGTEKGKRAATSELQRMAKLADRYVTLQAEAAKPNDPSYIINEERS